jgi:hypothetical protein
MSNLWGGGQLLLWAGSWAEHVKITKNGIPRPHDNVAGVGWTTVPYALDLFELYYHLNTNEENVTQPLVKIHQCAKSEH